ncbi:MAG: AAA family ATPase [Gemmatimonadota bacterium]
MPQAQNQPTGAGRVILLNGASCSGKTTLALVLQKVLEEPHLHLCVDHLLGMLPEHCRDWHDPRNQRAAQRAIAAMPHCVAALAGAGNHLIVDATLTTLDHLFEYAYLLSHLNVTFVGVHCEMEELQKRAEKRGERSVEVALTQARQVHAHGLYDEQVDTTRALPMKLAEHIKTHLAGHPNPTALRRLRSERLALKDDAPADQ